jgi:hypothetical protein
MDVTFTKSPGRRYQVSVERQIGPRLAPRFGPGYDPYLPHDLVHFVVEVEAGLTGAVFGRIAAGDSGFLWPVDPVERRRATRRKRRPAGWERAEMSRSERLAGVCWSVWMHEAGHIATLPDWLSPEESDAPLVRRICARLDELAQQWQALQPGGSLTLTWPHAEGRRHQAASKRRPKTRTVRRPKS